MFQQNTLPNAYSALKAYFYLQFPVHGRKHQDWFLPIVLMLQNLQFQWTSSWQLPTLCLLRETTPTSRSNHHLGWRHASSILTLSTPLLTRSLTSWSENSKNSIFMFPHFACFHPVNKLVTLVISGVRYASCGPYITTSKSLWEVQFVIVYFGHLLWNMLCAFSLSIS